jgi:hypothetical protein
VSKTFQFCRQIFQDTATQEYLLLGPTHQAIVPEFPAFVDLSLYARWTSVQGTYRLELQLQDLEGEVVWAAPEGAPLEGRDPLLVCVITLRHNQVFFPSPGKYDMVMLANGDEVIRDVFWAHLGRPISPE